MGKRNISRLKEEIAKLKDKIKDKDKELMKIRGEHMGTCCELLGVKVDALVKKQKEK